MLALGILHSVSHEYKVINISYTTHLVLVMVSLYPFWYVLTTLTTTELKCSFFQTLRQLVFKKYYHAFDLLTTLTFGRWLAPTSDLRQLLALGLCTSAVVGSSPPSVSAPESSSCPGVSW